MKFHGEDQTWVNSDPLAVDFFGAVGNFPPGKLFTIKSVKGHHRICENHRFESSPMTVQPSPTRHLANPSSKVLVRNGPRPRHTDVKPWSIFNKMRICRVKVSLTLAVAFFTAFAFAGCSSPAVRQQRLVSRPNMIFSDSPAFNYNSPRLLPQIAPGFASAGASQNSGCTSCR